MLEIQGGFYNYYNKEIKINYKLMVRKLGNSNSSSTQSGNYKVKSKTHVILSKITMNLDKEDLYTINLEVFNNKKLIAEDTAIFYGDEIKLN